MLKEALQFLSEKLVNGDRVSLVTMPDGDSIVVGPDGVILRTIDGFPTRKVECLSLADFVSTFQEAVRDVGDGDDAAASISVGVSGVTGYVRAGCQQYLIYYPLCLTKPAAALSKLLSGATFEQRDLLKILRTELRGAVNDTLSLQFKRVEFDSGISSKSEIERGRESLGRQVEREVRNSAELPESFAVNCDLYTGVAATIKIEVLVDIDIEEEEFYLWIDSQEWNRQLEKVRAAISAEIAKSTNVPILVGTITKEVIEKAALFN